MHFDQTIDLGFKAAEVPEVVTQTPAEFVV